MSRNDWEKSPNDRKKEAFHSPDEIKKTKASKKPDRPFVVEIRYIKVSDYIFRFLMDWAGKRKFETLEQAQIFSKKLKREALSERREIRITDARDGSIHALD